jgi:hypothetical protein
MTLTDFVWISVGELLLAGTFALGILVGIALKPRKESTHGNCNEGTENDWNYTGNLNAQGGTCRRAQGCPDKAREAHPGQRQTR